MTNENEERFRDFRRWFPEIKLVFEDSKDLKFPDNHFDIVFCNAVLEHVGNNEEQRKFVCELCREGKRIFIAIPNYWFPVDSHTLIPLAHWLSERIRFWVYRKLGREYWADINHLNLLTPTKFLRLFIRETKPRLYKHQSFEIPHSLIAIVEKS